MNLNLLTTRITLIFALTVFLFIAVFIFYVQYENKSINNQVNNYYKNLTNTLIKYRHPRDEVIVYMQNYNFEDVQNHQYVFEIQKRQNLYSI